MRRTDLSARQVVTGTRVVAFLSARGGMGRSTVAECLGYELAVRNNLQTMLLAAIYRQHGLPCNRSALRAQCDGVFRRPVDGFNAAIQKCERLDIITSPVNSVEYALAAERGMSGPPACTTCFRPPGRATMPRYCWILPAGEQPWTLEGISRPIQP